MTRKLSLLSALVFASLVAARPANAVTYTCALVADGASCSGQIPDIPSRNLTSTFTVPAGDCGTITTVADVDLRLQIAHGWVGDLDVELVHPDGTHSAKLVNRPDVTAQDTHGCTGDDVDAVFADEATDPITCARSIPMLSGIVQPAASLSVFDGLPRAGVWTLKVSDKGRTVNGALVGWALDLPCALPVVSIQGAATTIAEGASVVVTVRRASDLDKAMSVTLMVSGTADMADFSGVPATVSFPIGVATQTFTVTATADGGGEGAETIIIAVATGEHVLEGDPVTLTIAADPTIPAAPACGNGVVESGETCDDSNTTAGDGCSATCATEPAPLPPEETPDETPDEETPEPPKTGCKCGSSTPDASLLLLGLALFTRRLRRRR